MDQPTTTVAGFADRLAAATATAEGDWDPVCALVAEEATLTASGPGIPLVRTTLATALEAWHPGARVTLHELTAAEPDAEDGEGSATTAVTTRFEGTAFPTGDVAGTLTLDVRDGLITAATLELDTDLLRAARNA